MTSNLRISPFNNTYIYKERHPELVGGRGLKNYELSNHLGNVLAVVTDKKMIQASAGVIDAYYPGITASQDYYAFGSIQPHRRYKRIDNNGKDRLSVRIRFHHVDVNTDVEILFPGDVSDPANYINFNLNDYTSIEDFIDQFAQGVNGAFPYIQATREGRDLVMTVSPDDTPIDWCDNEIRVLLHGGAGNVKVIESIQCGDLHRYLFNGQEQEAEVYGEGNLYSAEYWMYDPRICRRWNTDPVIAPFESPYAPFRNSPILLDDPEGDCADCPTDGKEGDTYTNSKGETFTNYSGGAVGWASDALTVDIIATKKSSSGITKAVELGLDAASVIPGLETVADATAVVYYGLKFAFTNNSEDRNNLLFSVAGLALPGVGAAVLRQGAKLVRHGTNIATTTAENTHSVYAGFNKVTGQIEYVGITKRKPEVRWAEHARSGTPVANLKFQVLEGKTKLTKAQAREIEQQLIDKYGMQHRGGQLLNKRNSISPTR